MATKKLKKGKDSGDYLYQQLCDLLRKDIQDGKYAPGERLPSMDRLAAQHSINKITVLKALTELRRAGYVYSRPAQGTYVAETLPVLGKKANDTKRFCVVSQILSTGHIGPYHHDVLSGMESEIANAGAMMMILPQQPDAHEDRILESIQEVGADAVVYLGVNNYDDMRALVRHGPPSVLMDDHLTGEQVDCIIPDNRSGAFKAIEHLIGLGHTRIALMDGLTNNPTNITRMLGARLALMEAGISMDSIKIVSGGFTRAGGGGAMKKLLASKNQPTAIFCFNDEMAVGAVQELHSSSDLRVPQDISIIGFDNIDWCEAVIPTLTTINVDRAMMGQLAISRLLERIQNPDQTASTVTINVNLVVRESTAPPAE